MIQKETSPQGVVYYRKITTVKRVALCLTCHAPTYVRCKTYYPHSTNLVPDTYPYCPECLERFAQADMARGWKIELV